VTSAPTPDDKGSLRAVTLRLAAALAADAASAPREWPEAALLGYLEVARCAYAQLAFASEDLELARREELRVLYNYATERFAELLFARREDAAARGLDSGDLALASWRVRLGAVEVRVPGGQEMPVELVAASRLRFDGLAAVHTTPGLGAAFVVVGAATAPTRAFIEAPFVAATVTLRFAGDGLDEALAATSAVLDVHDPSTTDSVWLGRDSAALAANFTAPHALWLARSSFERQAELALLRRKSQLQGPVVYATEPYDPNQETIVLLHGLGASPATWANLVNEIVGDAGLRARYQVWQVFYPTNLPPAENQRTIREALRRAFAAVDPEARHAASRRVTLIGHSLGGVIGRLLVLDSGDSLWRELFGARFEQVRANAELEPYLTLAALPEVDTAVFIAAPHRGAPIARNWVGRLAARLVRLPAGFVAKVRSLSALLTDEIERDGVRLAKHPTSVRALGDGDEFLRITASLPISRRVTYHTIVARKSAEVPLRSSSDGVVPYVSAHLDGAASELVVESGHGVHQTAQAIAEIKRILRERPGTFADSLEPVARLDAPFARRRRPDERHSERGAHVFAEH
jgi:pimeloyl-ACP methyl ester carboxylesterase